MNRFIFVLLLLTGSCTKDPKAFKILSSWPEKGPELYLEVQGLGFGYSSPAVTDKQIFVSGETDSIGYLYSYDLDGNLLWKTSFGKEWTTSFRGSRSTPVVVDDLVYTCSGMGEISCFSTLNGNRKWSVNMISDLGGVNANYGYSMHLLMDDDKLYCSPGGEQNNVVALNRFNGKMIWSSPAKSEPPGYGSPILIPFKNRNILVTSSEFNILGLDASNGLLLWSYELSFKGNLPCNAPVFDGTYIYWVAGAVNGAVSAKISPDGSQISIVWKNPDFDTYFGNFISLGKYLYGSSDRFNQMVSLDAGTGKILTSVSFGKGSVILADSMLIAYNQRGQVALIKPDGEKLELVSLFRIIKGTSEHFSHPVFAGGKLYIRHGNVLLAYKISG